MAASAATFIFWNFFGTGLFPEALDAFADSLSESIEASYEAMGSGAWGTGAAGAAAAPGLLLAIKLAVDVLVVSSQPFAHLCLSFTACCGKGVSGAAAAPGLLLAVNLAVDVLVVSYGDS